MGINRLNPVQKATYFSYKRSRESKGKLIRLMYCKLSDLGVMLSLFVELWFKFLDVDLFQSMSLCRIFNPKQAGGGGAESAHRLVLPTAVLKRYAVGS